MQTPLVILIAVSAFFLGGLSALLTVRWLLRHAERPEAPNPWQ